MKNDNQFNPLPPLDSGQSPSQFVTERLQLAIYLHATGKLCFLRCNATGAGKVRFVFDDPNNLGDQLELEFDRGATVAGTAIFASQKFLRRKMSEKLNNRRNGESTYGYSE